MDFIVTFTKKGSGDSIQATVFEAGSTVKDVLQDIEDNYPLITPLTIVEYTSAPNSQYVRHVVAGNRWNIGGDVFK